MFFRSVLIIHFAAFILMLINLFMINSRRKLWCKIVSASLSDMSGKILLVYESLIFCFAVIYLVFLGRIAFGVSDGNFSFLLSQILFWGAVFVWISISITQKLIHGLIVKKDMAIRGLTLDNQTALDSIPGGVRTSYYQGEDLIVNHVNSLFTEITGYSLSDLRQEGRNDYFFICYNDDERKMLKEELDAIKDGNSEASVVYRIKNSQNELVWVSETIKSEKKPNGQTGLISVMVDISHKMKEEHEHKKRLIRDSETDHLTGLLNKVSFEKTAEKFIIHNPDKNAAFLMIDMDNFKYINDKYGHPSGDDAIRQTAEFLKSSLNEYGALIGRIGGDEFMAMIPGIEDENTLEEVADKLQNSFRLNLVIDENVSHTYTGSVGLYTAPCNGRCFLDFYTATDKNLYINKLERKSKPQQ